MHLNCAHTFSVLYLLVYYYYFYFCFIQPSSSSQTGEIEESLSSSEFERFLAERAAAAEDLPAGSSENEPKRNKEKQSDTMFAL